MRRQFKTLVMVMLLSTAYPITSAQAGVFDSLLEILLPSYNANESGSDSDSDTEPNETGVGDTGSDENTNIDANTDINTQNTLPMPNLTADSTIDSAQMPASVSIVTTTTEHSVPADLEFINDIDMLSSYQKPSLYTLLEAEFAIDRGDIDHGLALYKQESFTDNAASVFERALSLSMDYEPVDNSLHFSHAWQKRNPEHLPAQFYVAHLALKAHHYTLASDVLTQILNYDPNADLSGILVGIFPDNEKDQRELLATLKTLPEHKNASILTMQAGLLYQLERYELALYNIGLALEAKPDNVPYIILKADILQHLLTPERVIDFIAKQRQQLSNNPSAKRLYLYEIRYRLKLGESQAAWELLLTTHRRFSKDTEITLLAALVSIDVEEFETADKLLSSLASLPSYLDQAYYYLGISAERQQKFDEAQRYLSKVMREDLVWEARQKVVAMQLLDGDADGAIATLKLLSDQFDLYTPESSVLQAEILRQLDRTNEAKELLDKVNQQYPDNLDIMYARSQILDGSINSEYVLKRNILERLMLLNPENTDYQISYAQLLFSDYDDRAQSLVVAHAIVDIPFDDPRFKSKNYVAALNLLATDALSKDNYNEVLSYLRTPYEVIPTLESGILLLRAYQGLGDTAEVERLFIDLQDKFALDQTDISDHLQPY